jgi:hypothetical protein
MPQHSLAALLSSLAKAHAWAATVLLDELDAGFFDSSPQGG